MDEKTLRLLDKVTDKHATKIADRLVDKFGLVGVTVSIFVMHFGSLKSLALRCS